MLVHTCHRSHPATLSVGGSAKPMAAQTESQSYKLIGEQTPAASAVPWNPTPVICRLPQMNSQPMMAFPPAAPESPLCVCVAAPGLRECKSFPQLAGVLVGRTQQTGRGAPIRPRQFIPNFRSYKCITGKQG